MWSKYREGWFGYQITDWSFNNLLIPFFISIFLSWLLTLYIFCFYLCATMKTLNNIYNTLVSKNWLWWWNNSIMEKSV